MVAVCCVVVLAVGVERAQFRFSGYEDQTVFVELADWLANDPTDPGLRSRRVGVVSGDTRWDTDGWTYTHAAWVWTSGVPAAELIWFRLTPLFVWAAPLAVFALAYEVTRREETAAWSTAALVIFGLMTVDSLVYYPTTITFGQFALFQVNTLRTLATALMTPLALMTGLAYLRAPSHRHLLLLLVAGLALASLHPRQIIILLYSIGAAAVLVSAAQPTRERLRRLALLAAALALLIALPLAQRMNRPFLAIMSQTTIENEAERAVEGDADNPRTSLLFLDAPVLGRTYIIDPAFIFYHPALAAAVALALLIALRWRGSLAAQYVAASTGATLALLFVPGLAALFANLVSPDLAPGIVFGIPVALIFGISIDAALAWLCRANLRLAVLQSAAALVVIAVIAFLLFEPVPIPASARDQIRASNLMQAGRDMQPADRLLIERLRDLLPRNQVSVVLTPDRIANYVVESIPRTLVTGGRDSGNRTAAQTRRFHELASDYPPWLDDRDSRFLNRWGVTHIVVEADNPRLTQLLLEPERFDLLDTVAGYTIFRVASTQPRVEDSLYSGMTYFYRRQQNRRWAQPGFDLQQPGNPEGWASIIAQAEGIDGESALVARAFSSLMLGDDAAALPLWQQLHDAHPDIPLVTEALAHTLLALDQPDAAADVLLAALERPETASRVLAARALITADFFYLLDADERRRVIATAEADALVWDQLAVRDQPDATRSRVALLLSAGEFDSAARWHEAIPGPEVTPQDLVTRASLALAKGDIERALALLQPATDADWIAPNAQVHPDRWQNNIAAQTYYLLVGDLARRDGRLGDAEAAFRRAIEAGSLWAGRYFLAQTLTAQGNTEEAAALSAQLAADWQAAYDRSMPELVSLLTLVDNGAVFVTDAQVSQAEAANTVTVTATYGSLHGTPYPAREWRIAVLNPDTGSFYAEVTVAGVYIPGALVRASMTLNLPDDLPPLTRALVYIEPRYDNRVTFGSLITPVVLNRPASAIPSANALPVDAALGDLMSLVSFDADADADKLRLTLYWQASAPVPADFQVFVHVLDAAGNIVAQRDTAPVNGAYPTSQWRFDTLVEDTHQFVFDPPLTPGAYRVAIGLYDAVDQRRLPVGTAAYPVSDDRLILYEFVVE